MNRNASIAAARSGAVTPATRAFFADLFDDAGLFPPASRTMDETQRDHALQRRGPLGWILGRLVVPVYRLDDFVSRLEELPEGVRGDGPWPLTALGGPESAADAQRIVEFNARHRATSIRVLSLEVVARSGRDVEAARRVLPADTGLVLELPRESWLGRDLPDLLRAVKAVGARAKIRTGGPRETDIPPAAAVLRVLEACAHERLAFKATAGLHHPVRGRQPLTYAADSPRATMHGYLNVMLAALALWHGRNAGSAGRMLQDEDARAFRFDAEAVHWRAFSFTAAEVAEARRDFATAIGTCSFTEPIEEIEALGVDLGENR
jgi:hypothetical protein